MYTIRFWFEHGGGCLWSKDKATNACYGYKIHPAQLPISESMIALLETLEARYATCLNWDDPAAGSQWSVEEKAEFARAATTAYDRLCGELGAEYTVINELEYFL